jgi:hypothetical protein
MSLPIRITLIAFATTVAALISVVSPIIFVVVISTGILAAAWEMIND